MRRRTRLVTLCVTLLILARATLLSTSAQVQVYRSVKTNTKRIAITFDDGPHPYLTERILKTLDGYGVKATFFMVGVNVVNYPDAAKAVISAGHEVGNHTFSHDDMKRLSEAQVQRELGLCEDALEELCEYRPHLFRPPEGAVNTYIEHCTERNDYTMILWSLDTRDWENKNTELIVDRVLSSIRAGDIILLHDYIGRASKTPEALEILLPKLLEAGYEPVTVSQLLGVG